MVRSSNLLDRARASPNGWGHREVIRLLEQAGFEAYEGASHTIVRHPRYTDIPPLPVPRHRDISPYVVREAVKRIDAAEAKGE